MAVQRPSRKSYFERMFGNYVRFHSNTVDLVLHALLLPLGLVSGMLVLLAIFGHLLFATFTTVYVLCYSAMVPRNTYILSGVIVIGCAFSAFLIETVLQLHVLQCMSLVLVYTGLQYAAHEVTNEPMFFQEYSKLPNAMDHLIEQFVFRVPLLLTALYTFRANFALWMVHHRGIVNDCFVDKHDVKCIAHASILADKLGIANLGKSGSVLVGVVSIPVTDNDAGESEVKNLEKSDKNEQGKQEVHEEEEEEEEEEGEEEEVQQEIEEGEEQKAGQQEVHEQEQDQEGKNEEHEELIEQVLPQTLAAICAEISTSPTLRFALSSIYDEQTFASRHLGSLDEVLALHPSDSHEHFRREFALHSRGWLLNFIPFVSLHTCYVPLIPSSGGDTRCQVVGWEDEWRHKFFPESQVPVVHVSELNRFALVDQYAVPFRFEMCATETEKKKQTAAMLLSVNMLVYPVRFGMFVRMLEPLLRSKWGGFGISDGWLGVKVFEYMGIGNAIMLVMTSLLVWALGGSLFTFALLVGGTHQLVSIASLCLSPYAKSISHYTVMRDSVLSHGLFWISFAVFYLQAQETGSVFVSQGFILTGVILSLSGWFTLGAARACCAAEYGLLPYEWVTSVPFNLGIPHPIFTGELLALMGGFLLPEWRESSEAVVFGVCAGLLTLAVIYVEQYGVRFSR